MVAQLASVSWTALELSTQIAPTTIDEAQRRKIRAVIHHTSTTKVNS